VGEAYHPSSELVHQVQGRELAVDARGVLRGQEAGALAFSLGPSEVVATYGFAEPCEAVELGDGACKAAGEIAGAHRELAGVRGGVARTCGASGHCPDSRRSRLTRPDSTRPAERSSVPAQAFSISSRCSVLNER